VAVLLAGAGLLRRVEIDTTCFVGNAPGWVALSAEPGGRAVLPRTRVQPDTRHRFLIDGQEPVTGVRLDVLPDGGLARLRVFGELTPEGLATVRGRWLDTAYG